MTRAFARADVATGEGFRWVSGSGQQADRSAVPVGVAVFPDDFSVRALVECEHNVVHWSEFDRGGHFAAMETPDVMVGDIREFIRGLLS